ncbi:hypothetical protein J2X76_001623 [Neorhizobium sp. 2083]|uniref:hypothetical protein n=1 Tax=Neorhizobium sp. 2083 TaxID=2817762 RepID=UPI00286535D7|nr:hypothetical protein [Neorhizobium sp. 2083]MDR6816450.1 hypothetical protein [Neorhizobium sp. 2083]
MLVANDIKPLSHDIGMERTQRLSEVQDRTAWLGLFVKTVTRDHINVHPMRDATDASSTNY